MSHVVVNCMVEVYFVLRYFVHPILFFLLLIYLHGLLCWHIFGSGNTIELSFNGKQVLLKFFLLFLLLLYVSLKILFTNYSLLETLLGGDW